MPALAAGFFSDFTGPKKNRLQVNPETGLFICLNGEELIQPSFLPFPPLPFPSRVP